MSNLSRRNFITGGAIAALGGTLAIAGCAPKGESSSTVAGAAGEGAQAWTGTANGKGGELTVEVITEGDSIARINLLKSRESYGVGTAGIDVLSDLIVKNQTLNVDMVTGALLYVGNMRLENRAICINKEGDRFVEEMERRDVISNAIKEQTDGIGYMIFNQDGLDHTDIATVNAAEMDGLFGRGQLAKGETIAEVCEPFGIDAAELQLSLIHI